MNSSHPTPVRRAVVLLAAAASCLAFSGCASFWRDSRVHEASSVVQFLYPDQNLPFIEPQIPTLRLPLKVGVAFVPSGIRSGRPDPGRFTEAHKTALLNQVAAQFKGLPFVQSIEIVPTTYLRPHGGFENLDQLRGLLGVDVIALVAYDQAQNSHDTEWSLAYWTIVGAYVVPAQKNETHTLMEAVVYDISSRSLLFRAPGTSVVGGHSTPVRADEELARDAREGFDLAAKDMTLQLQRELESFKVRIREEPARVRIEHRPGYTGGGALERDFILLALGALAAGYAIRRLRS